MIRRFAEQNYPDLTAKLFTLTFEEDAAVIALPMPKVRPVEKEGLAFVLTLIPEYGAEPISRKRLAQKAGYTDNSNFRGILAALRRSNLIFYPSTGKITKQKK